MISIKETIFQIDVERVLFDLFDNEKLASDVLSCQTRMSTDPSSCLFEDTYFNPSDSEGRFFLDEITSFFRGRGLTISSVWSQIHKPLESTNTHHHGDSDMAFVYYVRVPTGAGQIVFELDQLYAGIHPQESTMLIFPGWLKHKVNKNMSPDIRISISGNLLKSSNHEIL
jgi:hypothetical protein